MRAIIWRILIGVLAFLFVWAILPPLLRILGLAPDTDVMQVIRLCVAGLTVLYILLGPNPPWVTP